MFLKLTWNVKKQFPFYDLRKPLLEIFIFPFKKKSFENIFTGGYVSLEIIMIRR